MKLPRAAAAVVVLVALQHTSIAQETRPGDSVIERVRQLARGSEKERMAALLYLEDARSADVEAWKLAMGYVTGRQSELLSDAKFMARVFRGLGRVGEPELKTLLAQTFDEYDQLPWAPECKNAFGVAVGLFGDPELIGNLGLYGAPMNFFAIGLMKKLPPDGLPSIPSEPDSRPSTDTFTDPVEAALRWGAVLDPPVFTELARSVLASQPNPVRLRAAVDYFARSKAKAPGDVRPVLTEHLKAEDPELAGLAARALAKSEGADDAEVAAIEAAFLSGVDRVAQVDRVRALGSMKTPAAGQALVRAIGLSRSDPAVQRTVMEALKSVPWDKTGAGPRKLAAAMVRGVIQPAEGETPAPADVRAAAVLALASIDASAFQSMLPWLRLSAPWPVRAAMAEALLTLELPRSPEAFEPFYRLLKDPDRRVRIATWEAIANHAKEPSRAIDAGTTSAWVFIGLSRESSDWPSPTFALGTSDPVELSVVAKLHLAFPGRSLPPKLIPEAVRLIPHYEVEALQSVLDLAGSVAARFKTVEANDVLRGYLASHEISLRKQAKQLLAKNGIDAPEQPPEERPARLSRCIDRANRLYENPVPSAVIETNKGPITIQLFAVDAPGTVENFLRLAKDGFYDGILWHRVVPAFVAQAGCPRGDGWGGPGYTIRCEVNDRTYRRGSIGMALAGKDTGGSQFFICHRALPHLDGRYTLFGRVTDGMDVVDKLGQEDWIVRVREL